VPFILQFFIDYNLYGMNQIRLDDMKFRLPVNTTGDESSPTLSEHTATPKINSTRAAEMINVARLPEHKLMAKEVERVSTCALEGDTTAVNILNAKSERVSGAPAAGGNPGIEFIWADERARRLAAGKSDPLTPPGSPPRSQIAACESHEFYLDRLHARLREAGERVEEEKEEAPSWANISNVSDCLTLLDSGFEYV
jgi:hypothetical protein